MLREGPGVPWWSSGRGEIFRGITDGPIFLDQRFPVPRVRLSVEHCFILFLFYIPRMFFFNGGPFLGMLMFQTSRRFAASVVRWIYIPVFWLVLLLDSGRTPIPHSSPLLARCTVTPFCHDHGAAWLKGVIMNRTGHHLLAVTIMYHRVTKCQFT